MPKILPTTKPGGVVPNHAKNDQAARPAISQINGVSLTASSMSAILTHFRMCAKYIIAQTGSGSIPHRSGSKGWYFRSNCVNNSGCGRELPQPGAREARQAGAYSNQHQLDEIMGFLKPAPGAPSLFEESFVERERAQPEKSSDASVLSWGVGGDMCSARPRPAKLKPNYTRPGTQMLLPQNSPSNIARGWSQPIPSSRKCGIGLFAPAAREGKGQWGSLRERLFWGIWFFNRPQFLAGAPL